MLLWSGCFIIATATLTRRLPEQESLEIDSLGCWWQRISESGGRRVAGHQSIWAFGGLGVAWVPVRLSAA